MIRNTPVLFIFFAALLTAVNAAEIVLHEGDLAPVEKAALERRHILGRRSPEKGLDGVVFNVETGVDFTRPVVDGLMKADAALALAAAGQSAFGAAPPQTTSVVEQDFVLAPAGGFRTVLSASAGNTVGEARSRNRIIRTASEVDALTLDVRRGFDLGGPAEVGVQLRELSRDGGHFARRHASDIGLELGDVTILARKALVEATQGSALPALAAVVAFNLTTNSRFSAPESATVGVDAQKSAGGGFYLNGSVRLTAPFENRDRNGLRLNSLSESAALGASYLVNPTSSVSVSVGEQSNAYRNRKTGASDMEKLRTSITVAFTKSVTVFVHTVLLGVSAGEGYSRVSSTGDRRVGLSATMIFQ